MWLDLFDPIGTGLLTEIETVDFGGKEVLRGKFKYTEDDMYGFNPTYTFSMDEQEELERYFRECVIKESKLLTKTNFVLLMCSFSYIAASCMFVSLGLNICSLYSHPLPFVSSYLGVMLPQIFCMMLYKEVFPMFNPKKHLDRKKYYKKLKLFLENEEEIQKLLKELNETNMNMYEFDGDIHNVRNSSYDEIVSLCKRIKK